MNSIIKLAAKIIKELTQSNGKNEANRMKCKARMKDWERF
jgi:hypothetical protein